MSILAESGLVHARWSEANREFLEFVQRNPRYLHRDSFGSIYRERCLHHYSIQPWPLFMDGARVRELEELALGMDVLVKSVVERFLDNDPARVAHFYRTRGTMDGRPSMAWAWTEEMVALLLEEPSGVWSAPSRGDYIETADGLRFIEYNAGSCLGGLQADTVSALYMGAEPTQRFLDERGRRARASGIRRAFFRHVVEDTVDQGVWTGGDFNLAMAVRPHLPSMVGEHNADWYTRELREVLHEHGPAPDGRVLFCAPEEVVVDRGGVWLDGHPVHAVIEQHSGEGDTRHLFRAFKLGMVNLFSGPISEILSDKRNLALLSEHAESDELTAEERALVQAHVPWTRCVAPGRTTFRGRPLRLPDDLPEHREHLVLKKASSVGGDFVEIGRFRTDAEWRDVVARAVWEEDWVVQEYLQTVPYCFQNGEQGAIRHEMVWGLFAFGDHYGGAFLRMRPAGEGAGVVNVRQGAEIGAVLELID